MKVGADRKYAIEFRDAAVKQVIEGGRSMTAVARSLEMSSKTLANWVYRTRKGQALIKRQPTKPASEMEAGAEGVELVYFGLARQAIGQGAGRWLMQEALAAASARGARRIWLHTCNYDHPRALGFYQRCGFAIYARGPSEIERYRRNSSAFSNTRERMSVTAVMSPLACSAS